MQKKQQATMKNRTAYTIVAMLITSAVALAQPAQGPDPRPKPITPDELNRVIGGSTLVTLKYTDARPEVVIASLAKQAGVHLHAYESTDLLKKLPAMSVEMTDTPCMLALKTLASRLGLNFTLTRSVSALEKSPAGLTLRLQTADDPQLRLDGPTLTRGPFIVSAASVQRARTVSLAAPGDKRPPATREDFWTDFVIMADPKLFKHGLLGMPTFFDADGWTFRSIDREGIWGRRANLHGTSPVEWRFSAHRRIGPGDAATVPALKTRAVRLLVTTKTQTWEVSDILTATEVSKEVTLAEGKRRYTIHEIKQVPNTDLSRRGEMYRVRLGVTGVGLKGKWTGWPEVTGNQLIESFRVVDADGRDFEPYGGFDYEKSVLSGVFWSGAGRGIGKAATGRPMRALWTLPAEIRSVEIPIEFGGLSVP